MKNGTQSILNFFPARRELREDAFWNWRTRSSHSAQTTILRKKMKVYSHMPQETIWSCVNNGIHEFYSFMHFKFTCQKRKENQISRFLLCPSFKLWTIEGHKYIPRNNLSLAFPTTIHIVVWSFSRRIASCINPIVYERILIFYSWPQDAIAHFFSSVLHVRFHMA